MRDMTIYLISFTSTWSKTVNPKYGWKPVGLKSEKGISICFIVNRISDVMSIKKTCQRIIIKKGPLSSGNIGT